MTFLTFLVSYILLFGIWQGTYKSDSLTLYNINVFMARKFNELRLLVSIVFKHPPGPRWTGGQEKAAQQLELSPAPKAGSALSPDSTTEQRSQRQLGFGFIPTNKELLLKAKRDLVSLLNFLDDEDQKSRRRRTSSS